MGAIEKCSAGDRRKREMRKKPARGSKGAKKMCKEKDADAVNKLRAVVWLQKGGTRRCARKEGKVTRRR